ncbi:MAG: hypothetical protein ACXVCI_01775 [Bdellovibrionota bacterium]
MLSALALSAALVTLPPAPVEYANRGYHEVLLQCPSSIWPGLAWGELQFLLGESGGDEVFLISARSPEPKAIVKDAHLRDVFAPDSSFEIFTFEGRKTIAVNFARGPVHRAFRVAVHELFHEVGQAPWQDRTVDIRGALYPLLSDPRYLRREAFESLLRAASAALAGNDAKADLGAARFWLEEWKKNFPEEVPMNTDSVEGTARYAELSAWLRLETGCGASAGEFASAFQRLAVPELTLSSSTSLEDEGYVVGAAAAFVLHALTPGWEGRMDGLKMTSDLAAGLAASVPQAGDETLRATYRREVAGQSVALKRVLDPEIARLQDKSLWRISVPASWQKSFEPSASYVLRDQTDLTLIELARHHRFAGEGGEIRLPAKAVVLQTARDECGGAFYFFLPPASVHGWDGEYSASFEGREFHFRGKTKTVNGATWVCPKE